MNQDSEQQGQQMQQESQTTGHAAENSVSKSSATGKSLVAFLRSIKFTTQRKPGDKTREKVGQRFARLHPRTRKFEKDSRWVPSAN